jgi:hypothetical protein
MTLVGFPGKYPVLCIRRHHKIAASHRRFFFHIRFISERTKAVLAAAKEGGKKLGGDRGHRHAPEDARRYGAAAGVKLAERASVAALCAASLIAEVKAELPGASLHAIADAMNTSPRGGMWTATAVRRALARVA